MLLNDMLNDKNCSELDVVKLINASCNGLDILQSTATKQFMQKKISFYLFIKAMGKSCGLFPNDNCLNMTENKFLSWKSFFRICIKSEIFNSLFDILFSDMPKHVLSIALKKFCHETSSFESKNDLLLFYCLLAAHVLSSTNGNSTEFDVDKLIDLSVFSSEIRLTHASCHHISNLKQAMAHLKRCKLSKNELKELDIGCLHRLQSLTVVEDFNVSVVQDYIELMQKPLTRENIENQQSNLKVPENVKCFCERLCGIIEITFKMNEKLNLDPVMKDYLSHLRLFSNELQNFIKFSSRVLDDGADADVQWTVDSALLTATNLLRDYDEAVQYLLTSVLNNCLDLATIKKCLEELGKVPECMMRTKHVVTLCKITRIFGSSVTDKICLQSAASLLSTVFDLLPLKSKISLVKCRCKSRELHWLSYSNLRLDGSSVGRKINMIFNKMTKSNATMDFDKFLHSVCNVTFIDPLSTLEKIIEHAVSHEEHHPLMKEVFQSLPEFLMMEDHQMRNILLTDLFKAIENQMEDQAIETVCKLVSLLLQIKVLNKDFALYFTNQMLNGFILQLLSENSGKSSSKANLGIDFALRLIKTIFYLFSKVSANDLFILVFILARIVDEGIASDGVSIKVKAGLIELINHLQTRISSKEVDFQILCLWLSNASQSLLWSTQLYLRPVLRSCSSYVTVLPESIKSVCTLPDTERFAFDVSYGEGTGLAVWLQCLTIDPSLFSIHSLNIQELSVEELDMFKHGMVVALSQVLPFYTEEDWTLAIESLKSLINQNCLSIAYPVSRTKNFPFVNLKHFRVPLSIVELLRSVTLILVSDCCKSWMTVTLWSRVARCYVLTVKQMFDSISCDQDTPEVVDELFFLSQLFLNSCDFLLLLESISNTNNARDSVNVLMLDMLTLFCSKLKSHSEPCPNGVYSMIAIMQSDIECIKCDQMKSALSKKLLSVS